ncbi:MAG: hypothetical protein IJF72_01160 [Clostridia bacterium]|nr:hypothetical protein [Clostridia bacterium]
MKKSIAIFLVCLTLLLAGCGQQTYDDGSIIVVIGYDQPTEYTVDLTKVKKDKGFLSVLQYLQEEYNLEIAYTDSGYGAYLTKVGSLEENPLSGAYIYVYTSVQSDFDVSQYAVFVDYKGETLWSSGLGITQMTIEDGCTIYVGVIYW